MFTLSGFDDIFHLEEICRYIRNITSMCRHWHISVQASDTAAAVAKAEAAQLRADVQQQREAAAKAEAEAAQLRTDLQQQQQASDTAAAVARAEAAQLHLKLLQQGIRVGR